MDDGRWMMDDDEAFCAFFLRPPRRAGRSVWHMGCWPHVGRVLGVSTRFTKFSILLHGTVELTVPALVPVVPSAPSLRQTRQWCAGSKPRNPLTGFDLAPLFVAPFSLTGRRKPVSPGLQVSRSVMATVCRLSC